ncbi:MAG: SIS domain-containing protein [Fimbriimonas sp.]
MRGHLMESEIREQPGILAAQADSYLRAAQSALAGKSFDMILLAARGSSDNAALFARYLFEIHVGLPVSLAAPSVLTRYGTHVRYPNCLAIGISQSGQAPDVSEVLADLRNAGHATLAVTNTEGSRMTQEAESTVLLGAGLEKSVAATKTFTASLLAMYQIARALGASLPDPKPHLPADDWVETALAAAQEKSGPIVRCNPIFALGRGFGFSTAVESALKLMECALIPAKSYSSADFEHGPKALAGAGSAALVFDGDKPHLREHGCELVTPPSSAEREAIPEEVTPIWDVMFGQSVALVAARARGLDPDQPRHLKKVTETL